LGGVGENRREKGAEEDIKVSGNQEVGNQGTRWTKKYSMLDADC
jgi:hypothetical protein